MDLSPVKHFNISEAKQGIGEAGKTNIMLASGAIEVGISKRRPGKRGAFHFHDGTEVILVLEGTLVVALADRNREYYAGDVIAIPPSLFHATHSPKGDAITVLIRQKTDSSKTSS